MPFELFGPIFSVDVLRGLSSCSACGKGLDLLCADVFTTFFNVGFAPTAKAKAFVAEEGLG